MGQNQSSEKEKPSSSRGGNPQQDRDRKVHRRTSVPALSTNRRAGAADAAATNVAAHGTTSHNLDTSGLERMLQSTSPELSSKTGSIDRNTSRRKKDQNHDMTMDIRESPIPSPSLGQGIAIPSNATPVPIRSREEELQDGTNSRIYEEPTYRPVAHHRPPRLPLPIAEVPESPSLGPVTQSNEDIPLMPDDQLPLDPGQSILPRRNSMLSQITEDEDVGEELTPFGADYPGELIPYTFEWHGPGDKVFVTGTFAAWDKKYRLKRSENDPEHYTTVLKLPPGTHHLKFFIDGNMVTSPDLPTAVDFNNILVNYIEISIDDLAKRESATRRESGQIPPTKVPPYQASPRPDAMEKDPDQDYSGTATPGENEEYATELGPEEMPEGDFRQLIPQALLDIDLPEDDMHYRNAAQVISEMGHPPSLPLFLSRSILNAGSNIGVKDDSSVLAMPNHTVLNHLMTSNVKNGVLATSVTTRYKKKYVTTISFKPVPRTIPFG